MSADQALDRPVAMSSAVRAVARRSMLMTMRNPPAIVIAVVQSVVFLLVFRYVFGGAISAGPLSYVDYMTPGLLNVGVLFTVMGVGPAVAEDIQRGTIARFRSLPMPRIAILLGRVLADHTLTASTLLITTAVALSVGFRPSSGLWGLLGVLGMCMVTAVAFTWVFIVVGLAVGDVQAAQGLGFLVMPLSFVSSAYVPVNSMPGWLQVFAEHQPMTIIVNASRYLAHGGAGLFGLSHSGGYYVVAALLWCGGILLTAIGAALVLFRRT